MKFYQTNQSKNVDGGNRLDDRRFDDDGGQSGGGKMGVVHSIQFAVSD